MYIYIQVGTKKIKTSRYQVIFKYRWYRVPGYWQVRPYDLRDAENADGILESSYKNGIYSLARNVMEFVKVWIN